jgi:hypothetical protein
MRDLWNRAAIGWAGRFIRDPSGPFMGIIAVQPVSASTLFCSKRKTNLAREASRTDPSHQHRGFVELAFRGIGAEQEMIRHVPSQQG